VSVTGTSYPPVPSTIEGDRVRAFARAIGADPEAGVPPTYAAVYALFATAVQLYGDPAAAVDNLIAHYETHGRMVLHLLSQESRVDLLADVARSGRRYHRMWVERTFGRELTGTVPEKKRRLAQLVAITDLYVWKVLRLDCGLDVTATKTSVRQLVEAVIAGGMR